MSPRVRICFDSDGYRYLLHGHPSSDEHGETVREHRLAAVAWGILDGLDDDREIHHVDGCPSFNAERNLVAADRREHIEHEIARAVQAGKVPPKWCLDALPTARRDQLVDGDGTLRPDADTVVQQPTVLADGSGQS